MALRRADARFLLPTLPATALVLGDARGWREALDDAAVPAPSSGARPDLAVADATAVDEAIATGASSIILEGPGRTRALTAAGFRVERWVPVPSVGAPEILVPLDHPPAARYALNRWAVPDARWKLARNRALSALASRGVWPARRPLVTIAAREKGPPAFLAEARSVGVETRHFFATLGGADDLARGVFFSFPDGSESPRWVVKFARVPGYAKAFELDQRGLDLAATIGGVVAARSPRLVGRVQIGGIEASVETAAVGERLVNRLKAPGPSGPKLAAIERIASWIVDVAAATTGPVDGLDEERKRLRDQVVPQWSSLGVSPDLVDRVARVAPVFRRGDLGSWNVVIDGDDFTAVDWETAQPRGFPLWDLLYFLSDALALLDGSEHGDARDDHARRLFRGEARYSPVLFEWVRRAVAISAVDPDDVGAIVTLLWLSVGLAHVTRRKEVALTSSRAGVVVPPAERVAAMWLSDRALGPNWDRWRQ